MTIKSNQEVILNDSVIYKQVFTDFLDNGVGGSREMRRDGGIVLS